MTGTAVSFSGVDWAVVAAYFIVNRVRCDAYGRTSIRIVRRAVESCFRTVPDTA